MFIRAAAVVMATVFGISFKHRGQSKVLRCCLAAAIAATVLICGATEAGVPVPEYSSRPGAAYTLYLDFGGFTWNNVWTTDSNGPHTPGPIPAYDTSGNSSSFNTTELANIKEIWSRVTEKYSAFSVNVTTVDPAIAAEQTSSDDARQTYYNSQAKMMHTVIGGNNTWLGGGGGVSYLGTTKNTYGSTTPYHLNFVFPLNLGKSNKPIAEATAHENGHGLDLDHQSDYANGTKHDEYSQGTPGSGTGTYAPIMGNSYNDQRGLWSVGTQPNGSIQNDVALLKSHNPSFTIVDDNVGHTLGTATPLTITGDTIDWSSSQGIITPNPSDATPTPTGLSHYTKDYWSFSTGGGLVTLNAISGRSTLTPGVADPGMMLDAALSILDSSGQVVAGSTYVSGQLNATLSLSLAAGDYYALVTSTDGDNGAGLFDTSYTSREFYDFGSYFLTGTIPAVPEPATLALLGLGGLMIIKRRRA